MSCSLARSFSFWSLVRVEVHQSWNWVRSNWCSFVFCMRSAEWLFWWSRSNYRLIEHLWPWAWPSKKSRFFVPCSEWIARSGSHCSWLSLSSSCGPGLRRCSSCSCSAHARWRFSLNQLANLALPWSPHRPGSWGRSLRRSSSGSGLTLRASVSPYWIQTCAFGRASERWDVGCKLICF